MDATHDVLVKMGGETKWVGLQEYVAELKKDEWIVKQGIDPLKVREALVKWREMGAVICEERVGIQI